MKKLFLGLALSALLGLPVWAALKVADKAAVLDSGIISGKRI